MSTSTLIPDTDDAIVARATPWYLLALGGIALVAITAAAVILLLRPAFPGDTSADAGFARDMSTHHAQAVEMAELVRGRTDNPEVGLLAREIPLVQQGQIGQMNGWLDVWGLRTTGTEPAMAWMGMPTDGPMPGMASREDLNELAGLEGAAADAKFLQLMIVHHEGGVAMAEAALASEVTAPVRQLASVIVDAQQAEIQTMRSLLDQVPGAAQPADADPMEGMDHGAAASEGHP